MAGILFTLPLPEGKRGIGVGGIETTAIKKAEERLRQAQKLERLGILGDQDQDLRSVFLDEVHGARAGAGGRLRDSARPQWRHHGPQRAGPRQLFYRFVSCDARAAEETLVTSSDTGLRGVGCTVRLADSGSAAINMFKKDPRDIELVLLDLSMPDMSGEEVLPALRKIRPKVEVLISSGYSEAETLKLFKGQQVSGFSQKPYTAKGLAEKVKLAFV